MSLTSELPRPPLYTLLIAELRGVGYSQRPLEGYAKRQMANDLNLLVESLGCGAPHVVGHDIGGMVAYAYAWQFSLKSLCILDVTIPGVGDWDDVVGTGKVWHFAFHQKRDIPETLVCGGREWLYITSFIRDLAFVHERLTDEDIAEYVLAYSRPGAFRAAMEMYRTFPQDILDNRSAGRLPASLPVLAIGGDKRWGAHMEKRLGAVSNNVVGGSIANCGHFVAEERPEEFLSLLLPFVRTVDEC